MTNKIGDLIRCAAAIVAFSTALSAQERLPPTPHALVATEMALLDVSVQLNRRELFYGEDICGSVLIRNSSGRSIDAFPPFRYPPGEFSLQERVSPELSATLGEWIGMEVGVDDSKMLSHETSSFLRSRDTVEIRSGDEITESVCLGSGVALKPGRYRFCFLYARPACEEFEVIALPAVLSLGKVSLPAYEEQVRQAGFRVEDGCVGMRTAVVEHEGKSVLLATYGRSDLCGRPELHVDDRERVVTQMTPYLRVAETPGSVRRVNATPDDGLGVRFQWMGADGAAESVRFEPKQRTVWHLMEERTKGRPR